jgi:hypothetical protein
MKHIVVKPKSTFERFRPKANNVLGKPHQHFCDGSARGKYKGKDYRHPSTLMHLSGTAQSGSHRIIRYECPACGVKRTYGVSG